LTARPPDHGHGRSLQADAGDGPAESHGKRRRARLHGAPGRAPHWEPVWEGIGEVQASIIAGGLESSGIRAQVTFNRLAAQPLTRESWFVLVRLQEAEAARHLLHQRGEGHAVVTGDQDISADQLATLKFVAVALLAAIVIGLLIAIKATG